VAKGKLRSLSTIVPASVMRDLQAHYAGSYIYIPSRQPLDYEHIRAQRQAGETIKQIAHSNGISERCVYKILADKN
jgi:Mor transcription activator family protein